MILEAVVTTVSRAGQLNIAAMGPHFNPDDDHFELRPFESSTTCQNLIENPCGVLHVTDDVLLITRCAFDGFDRYPDSIPATKINGVVLKNTCRWHEFTATPKLTDSKRRIFHCQIVESVRQRDFYGFNRAKHAVLEAAIAISRIDFLPIEEIHDHLRRLETIVGRTGGDSELAAFQLLQTFVDEKTSRMT